MCQVIGESEEEDVDSAPNVLLTCSWGDNQVSECFSNRVSYMVIWRCMSGAPNVVWGDPRFPRGRKSLQKPREGVMKGLD